MSRPDLCRTRRLNAVLSLFNRHIGHNSGRLVEMYIGHLGILEIGKCFYRVKAKCYAPNVFPLQTSFRVGLTFCLSIFEVQGNGLARS